MDATIARSVRIVAAANGKDVSDYLSAVLRPILMKELKKLGQKLTQVEDAEQ
jgi:hypothetical protein